ncbi:MAG: endonuclease MutS2 [Deltaproteobacteria bacterium]|nr:endonuclease MutS2 [Deltaproteobacteria bacterium]
MDKQTLEALEYNKIIERLSSLAITSCGKSLCNSIKPSTALQDINNALLDTFEMQEILKIHGELPLSWIIDVRPHLKKLSVENAYLLPEEFLQLKSTFTAIHYIRDFFPPISKKYPRISLKASNLCIYNQLLEGVTKTFDEKGCIKDSASPELSWIRKEILEVRNRARNILNELLRRQDLRPAFQDDFITIRDDRFCLALKSDFKGKMKGIIHSESGSGETYFIEPFETVELNNQLTILAKDERDEEIKILKKLSIVVMERRDDITKDIILLAEIDMIYAKAKFGIMLNSIKPEVCNGGDVHIIDARHPLLALKGSVVPVDMCLKYDKKVFVISGANTGGKTVALKTIGLLTLMAQSGFTIPAVEGSKINIFDNVIADIGDRQDIQLNLSTFSGHLKRLGEIMGTAGENTLVLIDEICDGTDPVEAGALSLAMLERLEFLGAVTVVTTHLNTLKSFAYTNDFAENISVEFNEVTLKPTYKLIYGIPGQSCAITIAEKWGIERDVIKKAKEYLKGTEGAGIEFIKTLEYEKKLLMDERLKLEELSRETLQINERRKKAVNRFDEERHELIERERKKAEEIIRLAEGELKKIIEEIRAHGFKDSRVRREALEEIKTKTLEALKTEKRKPSYTPKVGDVVNIMGRQNKGRIIDIDEDAGQAEVLIGSIKVRMSFESIEFAEKRHGEIAGDKLFSAFTIQPSASLSDVSREINIIGLTIDDAMPKVDKFIDNALLSSMTSVVIIHGAGTGRLRNAVHEYLKNHKAVKGFHYADIKQGGSGATVVEL